MAHVKQYPDLVRFEAMVDKAGRRGGRPHQPRDRRGADEYRHPASRRRLRVNSKRPAPVTAWRPQGAGLNV